MSHRIAMLVFDGFQMLDASGPVAVFETASHFADASGYRVELISSEGGLVRSSAGLAVQTVSLARAGDMDTLMVAGGTGSRDVPDAVLAFIRDRVPRVQRVASICTGAFLLAQAGVLDGRRATTHWRHAQGLARRYPSVEVLADRIWVRDDPFWTSAGVSAGIDLALALVAEDLGSAVARACAREVVVYYQRPGGQSQFSSVEELSAPGGRFAPLLGWIRSNVARRIRVDDLAEHMAMSPRNFSRCFRAEIGCTPAQAVARIRLEVARTQVESTRRPIEEIARLSGFGEAETMRRAFVRAFGQPPRALRTGASGRPGQLTSQR